MDGALENLDMEALRTAALDGMVLDLEMAFDKGWCSCIDYLAKKGFIFVSGTAEELELRDKFAGDALQAIITGVCIDENIGPDTSSIVDAPSMAYEYADAMMEARGK